MNDTFSFSIEVEGEEVFIPGPLNEHGIHFYRKVHSYLKGSGLYNDVDSLLVFQASIWWQQYLDSEEGIRKYGTVVHYETGHQQVSPHVSNLQKAQAALSILMTKLGIGEEARRKLKMSRAGKEEDDPMNNF